MTSKLKLDAEALVITSFDTVEMAATGGAVLEAGGAMAASGSGVHPDSPHGPLLRRHPPVLTRFNVV